MTRQHRVVDQIVFRWDSDNVSGTTGFGPVAWSCPAETADSVFRGTGPLLRATGEATRPALLRLERGDLVLLVHRAPWRGAGGRASTVCHALLGPAGVLDPATCLGLHTWRWEGADAALARGRGELDPVPESVLHPAADEGAALLTHGLEETRSELTGAVAEFLRHPTAGYTLLDPTGRAACRVLWGLHGIFGDYIDKRWTFATHDTAETDQVRFVFVSRWTGEASGNSARRRADPAERHGDHAEEIAHHLVQRHLHEEYEVGAMLRTVAARHGAVPGRTPLLPLAERALLALDKRARRTRPSPGTGPAPAGEREAGREPGTARGPRTVTWRGTAPAPHRAGRAARAPSGLSPWAGRRSGCWFRAGEDGGVGTRGDPWYMRDAGSGAGPVAGEASAPGAEAGLREDRDPGPGARPGSGEAGASRGEDDPWYMRDAGSGADPVAGGEGASRAEAGPRYGRDPGAGPVPGEADASGAGAGSRYGRDAGPGVGPVPRDPDASGADGRDPRPGRGATEGAWPGTGSDGYEGGSPSGYGTRSGPGSEGYGEGSRSGYGTRSGPGSEGYGEGSGYGTRPAPGSEGYGEGSGYGVSPGSGADGHEGSARAVPAAGRGGRAAPGEPDFGADDPSAYGSRPGPGDRPEPGARDDRWPGYGEDGTADAYPRRSGPGDGRGVEPRSGAVPDQGARPGTDAAYGGRSGFGRGEGPGAGRDMTARAEGASSSPYGGSPGLGHDERAGRRTGDHPAGYTGDGATSSYEGSSGPGHGEGYGPRPGQDPAPSAYGRPSGTRQGDGAGPREGRDGEDARRAPLVGRGDPGPLAVVRPEWDGPPPGGPLQRWTRLPRLRWARGRDLAADAGSLPEPAAVAAAPDDQLLRALAVEGLPYETLTLLMAEAAARWPSWGRTRRTELAMTLLAGGLFLADAGPGDPGGDVRAANAAAVYRWAVRPQLDDMRVIVRLTQLLPELYASRDRAARAAVAQITDSPEPGLPEVTWQALLRAARDGGAPAAAPSPAHRGPGRSAPQPPPARPKAPPAHRLPEDRAPAGRTPEPPPERHRTADHRSQDHRARDRSPDRVQDGGPGRSPYIFVATVFGFILLAIAAVIVLSFRYLS
ncbi:hypothetical protein GCM10023237_13660 [Streptomyces coeruleoprunus]|uniref:hypothetical protein n=1 Tax=Streptomyces coeruleoprunus TaxID=285563 RepID=UPI0031EC88BB